MKAESNKSGGGMTRAEVGFLGAATTSATHLVCTLIYLSGVGKQTLSLFFLFYFIFFKRKSYLKGDWSRRYFSIMERSGVEWSGGGEISKTLFKKKQKWPGLNMHMLVHIQYTAKSK